MVEYKEGQAKAGWLLSITMAREEECGIKI